MGMLTDAKKAAPAATADLPADNRGSAGAEGPGAAPKKHKEASAKADTDKRVTRKAEMPKKHKKPAPTGKPQEADLPADEAGGGSAADSQSDADDSDTSDQSGAPAGADDSDDQDSDGGSQGGSAAAPPQGNQSGDQETYMSPDQTTQITQQGPPSVINPAAPGAGDDTSGGADTPDQTASGASGAADNDDGAAASTASAPGGAAGASDSASATGGVGGALSKGVSAANAKYTQIPLSPALKEEYERANQLLYKMLYGMPGDALAQGILRGLLPQGPMKIKSATMASLNVMTQLNKQLHLPPQIVLPFVKDVVLHVLELGEQVKQIQYSDQESAAVLGAAIEGALRIYGVSKKQMQSFQHLLPRSVLQDHLTKYQQLHAFAKPAIDANNQSWHHPELANAGPGPGATGTQPGAQNAGPQPGVAPGAQAAGLPQTPGPQTGAPVGAQATPQVGAPPQQQPPQAGPGATSAAGGMLAQAAGVQPS